MIGQTVSHYRILSQLGEGGMGAVYLAEDILLGRHVAVKFLALTRDGQKQRHRFLREARSASALSHPHIAAVHDYGETPEGQPYIVMEFVSGTTLDELIRREALPLARALEIVEDVAEALAEAHRHGIIHRDVKPSNVAVSERGTVKVLDFGLAKQLHGGRVPAGGPDSPTLIETQTSPNMILGTPLYLSPEQALGEPVDARSDLFSLGSVLYECVAGRPPFQGTSLMGIFAQVIHVDPPPPSQFNLEVPPELDRLVLKALAKRPEERYQSADEMLSDLRAARGHLSPSSAQATTARIARAGNTSPLSLALQTLPGRLRRPRFYVPLIALLCVALAAVWATRPARIAPIDPKAVERYVEGTRAVRDGTYYKASKLLEEAVRIDGRFALALARLAEAWVELDYTERALRALIDAQARARAQPALLRSLPEHHDPSYLEAIDATIRRDFTTAIKAYGEIARRLPGESYVYVDLGRAYEKNEEIDRAIENYRRAAELEPRDATAYLRLGILYGRKQEFPSAAAVFEQAEKNYQNVANYEGLTEVYYQRGHLANRTGKLAEARSLVNRALQISTSTGNKYQQIKALLLLSSISATEGKTEEAKQYSTQALDLARINGIENLTSQGLINLGAALFLRLEYGEAEAYFKQALAFAEGSGGRRNAALAHLSLARLYIQQENKAGEASAHLEQALAFYRQGGGYGREVSQALLLSGRAKLQQGDYGAALREFEQQLRVAEQLNDPKQLVNSQALIGAALAERELYPEALRHFTDGYAISKTAGFALNTGYGLLNRADMLWRLGRYTEARDALAELPAAVERLDSNYKQLLLARGRLVAAQMALSERRFDAAREEAERALADTRNERVVAEAKYVLCRVQTLTGARKGVSQACREAVELAGEQDDARLVSAAQLALAEALLESGDARAAFDTALRARESFAGAGQQESQWRALLVAGRAGLNLGERERAHELLTGADKLFFDLQRVWGAEAFRGYLTRADVQSYRRQLNEALAASK